MRTYNAKPGEIERVWYVVDADGRTLGRLATQIADTLRGKTKPQFTPHVDTGDFVVVVNAEKIHVTGKKLDDKLYHRHSGYRGGLKSRPLRDELAGGCRTVAVGRLAEKVTGADYVRHPSHGGAADFRAGLLRFALGGRKVRRFNESGA